MNIDPPKGGTPACKAIPKGNVKSISLYTTLKDEFKPCDTTSNPDKISKICNIIKFRYFYGLLAKYKREYTGNYFKLEQTFNPEVKSSARQIVDKITINFKSRMAKEGLGPLMETAKKMAAAQGISVDRLLEIISETNDEKLKEELLEGNQKYRGVLERYLKKLKDEKDAEKKRQEEYKKSSQEESKTIG